MSTKADYIITLIGKNPSPNYYTILNYCKPGTKVYAFYTPNEIESVSSKKILENIKKCIKEKDNSIVIKPVPCDKSEESNIEKCAKAGLDDILNDCNYENLGSKKINIIVDYTGATKSMSAFFYLFFNKIVETKKCEKLNINSSYASSSEMKIYECKFLPIETVSTYEIENMISEFNITKEDLIKLHGYKVVSENKEGICIGKCESNNKDNFYKFKNIDIEKGNLKFCVYESCEKIKDLVDDYFIISDEVEKIGGTEAHIYFNVKDYKHEEKEINSYKKARDWFYCCLSNIYSHDLEEKVHIKFENEEKNE